jgi:hypothetical protein
MSLKFSFTKWLAGKQAVSFALAIGVIFLITNYQNILHITNPENKDYFNYPFVLRVLLSHIDSLFFGLATAIFIFQSKSETQKILYCIFEAIMVGLNLNRGYLGADSLFYLSCYIAIFSGFTLYFLGTLAKQHNQNKESENTQQELSPTTQMPITNVFGEPYHTITAQHEPLQTTIGFDYGNNAPKAETVVKQTITNRKPRGKSIDHARVNDLLDKGLTATEIAQMMKCTESSIYKIKAQRNNTL